MKKAAKPKQQGKKAGKVTKPRKAKTTADKLQKKYTAGLVAKTEKMLGARAGHLELIGGKKTRGDKKDGKDGKQGKKGAKPADDKQKGGSRKFG